MTVEKYLIMQDRRDLRAFEIRQSPTNYRAVQWVYFTADDEAYMGMSHKQYIDITPDEFTTGLKRIDDNAIYPDIPPNITIASTTLDHPAAHLKRVGVQKYELPRNQVRKGFKTQDVRPEGGGPKAQLLKEAFIMETLSKTPHPYIIRYHGCRAHRGRITGIVLEALERDLHAYARKRPDAFARLDKEAFLAGVESAVRFLHSLGLAHNDINPRNVMVREAEEEDGGCARPVLIDFDSCVPFGSRLLNGGTYGFMDFEDSEYFLSLARHDEYSMERLREWWDEDHAAEDRFQV